MPLADVTPPGFWIGNPLAGILLTLLLLGLMLGCLKAYHVRFAPHPELLRKLVHIGMGLVTLSFPWLFDRPWPVMVLAVAAVALLIAVKAPGPLREVLGGVVDSVERPSHGDVYFPVAVALLFWLAGGDRLLFCIPILMLTLGDSIAALVGIRYGRLLFTTGRGRKSFEGSLACFIVTLMVTLVPLLRFSYIGWVQVLLIALIVALLATLLEAIAWDGLDNLFVPLGGFLLLKTHLQMSAPTLSVHLLVTLALFLLVVMWRRCTSLNDSAVLGAALYGYCVWSIGGVLWLFPPVVLFVAYPLIWPRTSRDAVRSLTIGVVFSVGAAGLVWLLVSVALRLPVLVYPFTVAFGAQMAMIGLARLRHRYPHLPGRLLLPASVAGSWLLLVAPVLIAETHRSQIAGRITASIAGVAIAAILFDLLRRDLRDYPCDPARWRLQAFLGAAGSVVGLAPILWSH